jgi:hypothetical protein
MPQVVDAGHGLTTASGPAQLFAKALKDTVNGPIYQANP